MYTMKTSSGLTEDEIYTIMLYVTAEKGGKYSFIDVIKGIRKANYCGLKDAKESAELACFLLYKKGLVGKYSWQVNGYSDEPITAPHAGIPLTPSQIAQRKLLK